MPWQTLFDLVIFLGCAGLLFLCMKVVNANRRSPISETLPGNPDFVLLVAFKDEPKIEDWIFHIRGLTKAPLVLVNDHSATHSVDYLRELKRKFAIQILTPPNFIRGKKNALRHALKVIENPYVLLLDADVWPEKRLFDTRKWPRAKMVLFPLKPIAANPMLRSFYDLDFLSLHYSGLVGANYGFPFLANGAAMLIERQAFIDTEMNRTDWDISSGDDVFLLNAVVRKYGAKAVKAAWLSPFAAQVAFPSSTRRLFSQRLRWMRKTRKLKNWRTQLMAWVVLLSQFFFVASLAYAAITLAYSRTFIFCGVLICCEFLSLFFYCRWARRTDLVKWIFPALLVYPLYLLILVASSIFVRPQWK